MRRDRPAAALGAVERALKVDPRDSESHYLKGMALARLGRAAEAAEARRRGETLREEVAELLESQAKLVKEPGNLELRGRIARWMFDHDQPDEAAKWAKLILERSPSDPAMTALLADYHARRGESGLANFYRLKAGDRR